MLDPRNHLIAACLTFASTLASAAPVTFFGEDMSPGGTVAFGSLAKAARDTFLGQFNGTVGSFGFERLTLGDGSTAVDVGNINFQGSSGTIRATLAGDGLVRDQPTLGRFNTTSGGSKYWEVRGDGIGSFSVNFNRKVAGFGFYATDVNDFGGSLKLILTSATVGNADVELLISPTPLNDGNLIFFGFADRSDSYTKITFRTTVGINTAPDYFGFDDFVIGDSNQLTVPEPGSILLAALALSGVALTRRRINARHGFSSVGG